MQNTVNKEVFQDVVNDAVEATTELTAEEALDLINEANGETIISAQGNRFLEVLNKPVKLRLLTTEIIVKDVFDDKVTPDMDLLTKVKDHAVSLNRTCRFSFADENNNDYYIDMFYFYWNRNTNKKINLKGYVESLRDSIFLATRTTTLQKASGQYMYITATEKKASSGKTYFEYAISSRK